MTLTVNTQRISLPNETKSHTFILALLIIGAYLLFFGIIIFSDKEKGYDGLKILTSTLGTLAAGVVGYYFGNKPVQQAVENAKTTEIYFNRKTCKKFLKWKKD